MSINKTASAEYRLHDAILKDYNPKVRPRINHWDTINITVNMSLYSIELVSVWSNWPIWKHRIDFSILSNKYIKFLPNFVFCTVDMYMILVYLICFTSLGSHAINKSLNLPTCTYPFNTKHFLMIVFNQNEEDETFGAIATLLLVSWDLNEQKSSQHPPTPAVSDERPCTNWILQHCAVMVHGFLIQLYCRNNCYPGSLKCSQKNYPIIVIKILDVYQLSGVVNQVNGPR